MAIDNRIYTTRRMGIVKALAEKFKCINGQHPYITDLEGRVEPRLKFWDEVQEFPTVHLNAGSETRDYQGGGYKNRYMTVTIRCYVQQEDSVEALEGLLEDLETVLEDEGHLIYMDRQNRPQTVKKITIITIDTDEGVLDPLGVGEVVCEVMY